MLPGIASFRLYMIKKSLILVRQSNCLPSQWALLLKERSLSPMMQNLFLKGIPHFGRPSLSRETNRKSQRNLFPFVKWQKNMTVYPYRSTGIGVSILVYGYTSIGTSVWALLFGVTPYFPAICTKGLHEYLFAWLNSQILPIRDLSFKERICSYR